MRLLLLIFLVCIYSTTLAQENNYWSVHQGAIAALNGGAVVANNQNQSAAFYNPGLLPFARKSSVSVNVMSYFLNNVNIENR